jgi:hypothetical protein
MSWFKTAFKNTGKALKSTAQFLKPIAQAGLSAIPMIGPMASELVNKLLPDAPQAVQQQAAEQLTNIAAQPPTSINYSTDIASKFKHMLNSSGVEAAQASALGAVAHGLSQLSPLESAAALHNVSGSLPNAPIANGFTKDDIKKVVDGAVKGAKDGAVDAYLDETAAGKQTKKDAIDAQGAKAMPFILGAGLLLVFLINKKK